MFYFAHVVAMMWYDDKIFFFFGTKRYAIKYSFSLRGAHVATSFAAGRIVHIIGSSTLNPLTSNDTTDDDDCAARVATVFACKNKECHYSKWHRFRFGLQSGVIIENGSEISRLDVVHGSPDGRDLSLDDPFPPCFIIPDTSLPFIDWKEGITCDQLSGIMERERLLFATVELTQPKPLQSPSCTTPPGSASFRQ